MEKQRKKKITEVITMEKQKKKKTTDFSCQVELGDSPNDFAFICERKRKNSWAVQADICPLFTFMPVFLGMGLLKRTGTPTTPSQLKSSGKRQHQPAIMLDGLTAQALPASSNRSSADTVSKLSSSGSVITNNSSQESVTSAKKRSKRQKSREVSPLPIELKRERTRGKSVEKLKVDSQGVETKKISRRKSRDVTPAAEPKRNRQSMDKKMSAQDTPSRERRETRSSSKCRSVDSMKKAETTKHSKKESGGRSSKAGSSSRSCERDVDAPRKRGSTAPAKREENRGNSSRENSGSRKRERPETSSKEANSKKAKVVNTAEVEKCVSIHTDMEKDRKLVISVVRLTDDDVIASCCKMNPKPCTLTVGNNAVEVNGSDEGGPRTEKEINKVGSEEDEEADVVSSSCGNTDMPSTNSVDEEEEVVGVSSSVRDMSDENQVSAGDNSWPATPASDVLVGQIEEQTTSPDGSAKKSEQSCIHDSVGDIGSSTSSESGRGEKGSSSKAVSPIFVLKERKRRKSTSAVSSREQLDNERVAESGRAELQLSIEKGSSSKAVSPALVLKERKSTSAVSSREQLDDVVRKRRRSCDVRKANPEDDVQVIKTIVNVNLGRPQLRIPKDTRDCDIRLMTRLLDAAHSK